MTPLQTTTIAVVGGGWLAFFVALVVARRRRRGPSRRRDVRSLGGMGLQGAGIGIVFGAQHVWGRPDPGSFLRAAVAILLTVAGTGLVLAAVWTLGKQWSLAARVLEDHELVTTGPYALVRHPIYSGLLALLLAMGLARSDLSTTLAGAAVYVGGTLLRTRREERLLRETFGEAYDAYARRVPALLPRLRVKT